MNLSLARQRQRIIAEIIGEGLGNLVSVSLYISPSLIPFAIGSRLFSDPLRRKMPQKGETFWVEREPVSSELTQAKRQG
ncbi:MAG UNVERIFIED_CONTAM: hypothetical protein LVT10_08795 [Anaerolineae bacterium]